MNEIALYNPMFYMIDGLRSAITGQQTAYWAVDLGIAVGGAAIAFVAALRLFQSGYKLRP